MFSAGGEEKGLTNTATKYEQDRKIEYRFSKTIKAILGCQFIIQDEIEDIKNGTDFMLLSVNPFRVAVRLRRFKYLSMYGNEFTIRWARPSGVKTEIHKIKEGLVNYLFYGFIDNIALAKYKIKRFSLTSSPTWV